MARNGSLPGPLNGIRVLDFTRHLAGAGSTRILATLGAEILRIEWPHPPALDFLRLSGPHADGRPGMNRGGFFAQINVGKKSVAIDMSTEAGKAIARELIPHCDVIAESFSPGVMKRWGLDYESVRALRPDIIYLSASGFGQTGPYAGYRSVGPTAQAYSGLTATSGLPDREPAGWGFSYMDHMGAVMNAAAILMGLERRRATGEGEFFDAGQSQHGCALLGPMLLDVSLNGAQVRPKGNRDLYGNFCPNNAYRCRGEDSWLAISVREPHEWAALCETIGADDLVARPELATLAGRLAHEDEIDSRIEAWTQPCDAHEAMAALQEAGVPAGVAQTVEDKVHRDPQLAFRGLYTTLDDPVLGEKRYEDVPVTMEGFEVGVPGPSPWLGADTRDVLGGLLGYSGEKLEQLKAEAIIDDAITLEEAQAV
ncbi:MAG: CoA transferase [Dehalococcoidia bacterium]|nr:CoA transferase [Dehalococcoidia bacterium]MYA54554.1 CoA transferase [Dehalococcoidia bacterium]